MKIKNKADKLDSGTHQEFQLMKTASLNHNGGHVVGPWATFHSSHRKVEVSRFKMVFVWWKSAEK